MAAPVLLPWIIQGARIVAPKIIRGVGLDVALDLIKKGAERAALKVSRSPKDKIPEGLTPSKPSNNPSYKPQGGGSPKTSEPSAPSNPKPPSYMEAVELGNRIDKLTENLSDFRNKSSQNLEGLSDFLSRLNNRVESLEALGSTSSPTISSSLHASALNSGRIASVLETFLPILEKLTSDKLEEEDKAEEEEGKDTEDDEAKPEVNLKNIVPKNNAEKIALAQARLIDRQGKTLEKVAPAIEKLGEYFTAKVNGEVEGMNALDLELSHAYTRYKLDEEKLQTYTVNDKEYTFTQLQAMQKLSTIAPLYKVNDEKLSLSELQAQRLSHWLSREIPMKIGAKTEKYSAADIAAYKDYSLVAPTAINLNPVANWDITSTSNPELSAIDAQKLRDTVEAKEKYNEASFDFSDLIDDQIPPWEEVKPLFKLKHLSAQVEEEKRKSNHGR